MTNTQYRILVWLSTIIVLYYIFVAGGLINWFGIFLEAQIHRAITLVFGLTLIFLLFNWKNEEKFGIKWYDAILLSSALISLGYVIFFYDEILRYVVVGALDTQGIILTAMLWIPLLEALRRKVGLALPILVVVMVSITVFQPYLPGLLHGPGYPIERLFYGSYVGVGGIFGMPLGVAAGILIIFLTFGALLQTAGAGKWFMDLAMALAGWSRGGPAKASVLASALFGSFTGSPSSNVATTGNITIPLMKQTGYTSKFAAATEAVASTGGNILPPIMGTVAFVMMEFIGVDYAEIALAAVIPAIMYFFITFMSVHFQAYKKGIQSLSRDQLPRIFTVIKEGWYYLVPLAALVYFLIVMRLPPAVAGVYTLPFVIAVSFLSKNREFWLTPVRLMESFYIAVKRWLVVVAITSSVGIFVGALQLSGVGQKFSRFVLAVSGEELILLLILVGVSSLILGMGMDALPAYITLATLLAPAIIALGVPDLSAHLFIMYWGMASFLTPPVCIAVYVAIGISGSRVWETGWETMKIGLACYVIPIAFILNPELVLNGEAHEVIIKTVILAIGCVFLASGTQGYAIFSSINVVERVILAGAGIAVITPSLPVALIAILIGVLVMLQRWIRERFFHNPNSISA